MNEPLEKEHDIVAFERRDPLQQSSHATSHTTSHATGGSLISQRQVEELRERWTNIQASFVDEPRKAIEDADKLVNSAIKQIEETFRSQRGDLEKQWNRGEQVSTEDLRVCLQRYRAFFDRLISL